MCWFDEKPLRVSAGMVTTPYHQLSMSIRAKSNEENRSARVFEQNYSAPVPVATPAANADPDTPTIDVGGSLANSGRAAPANAAATVLCESQDVGKGKLNAAMEGLGLSGSEKEAKVRLRIKEGNESEPSQGSGRKRNRDGGGEESKAGTWTRMRRRRKTSAVEKAIVQGQGVDGTSARCKGA